MCVITNTNCSERLDLAETGMTQGSGCTTGFVCASGADSLGSCAKMNSTSLSTKKTDSNTSGVKLCNEYRTVCLDCLGVMNWNSHVSATTIDTAFAGRRGSRPRT